MTLTPDVREEALGWLIRTNEPDFDAWDEFTVWLERDPAHADAYHHLAGVEADMLPLVEALPASPVPERREGRTRLALVAGIAVLAASATVIVAPRLMPVDYSTDAGEVQVVSLGGRDQLVLNGGTKLQLAGFDRRTVRLEQGQVLLRLQEPGQDKVRLLSGDLELVDVGTVFEVSRDGGDTRVLVSEGEVMADPGGAEVRVAAGHRLDTEDGATVLQATEADASQVGAFERGQLIYVDETLDLVLADLRRSTGIDFSASAAMRARRFSGTLSVAEIKRDPRSLGPLLGVSMEPSGKGWKLGGKV